MHGAAAIKALPKTNAALTLVLYEGTGAKLASFSGTLSTFGGATLTADVTKDAGSGTCDAVTKTGCTATPTGVSNANIDVLASELFAAGNGYSLGLDLAGADTAKVAFAEITVTEDTKVTTCSKVSGCTTTGSSVTVASAVSWSTIGTTWEGALSAEPLGAIACKVKAYEGIGAANGLATSLAVFARPEKPQFCCTGRLQTIRQRPSSVWLSPIVPSIAKISVCFRHLDALIPPSAGNRHPPTRVQAWPRVENGRQDRGVALLSTRLGPMGRHHPSRGSCRPSHRFPVQNSRAARGSRLFRHRLRHPLVARGSGASKCARSLCCRGLPQQSAVFCRRGTLLRPEKRRGVHTILHPMLRSPRRPQPAAPAVRQPSAREWARLAWTLPRRHPPSRRFARLPVRNLARCVSDYHPQAYTPVVRQNG